MGLVRLNTATTSRSATGGVAGSTAKSGRALAPPPPRHGRTSTTGHDRTLTPRARSPPRSPCPRRNQRAASPSESGRCVGLRHAALEFKAPQPTPGDGDV
ncbi:hypothetical protein GUJ93_ZPchr0009g1263 [Zizania palustris]|uniref:Uncharacterized protein n=1 Tax=Zizania palustris TaxID=103762 RepID=A0A8J5V753_ZIZPA|nr:hypothetical protein GUJ93_ZPchr0009g1263 [Zizania palustris]